MKNQRADIAEGYSADNPIPDEDWVDEVRWALNYRERERKYHDLNGFLCEMAGSKECLALGHVEPADGWDEDYDLHPQGWGGEAICPATRFQPACTQCEGECDGIEDDVTRDDFWRLPGVCGKVIRFDLEYGLRSATQARIDSEREAN